MAVHPFLLMTVYKLNRERLMLALMSAYSDACRHKRKRGYVKCFDERRKENLSRLCDELLNRTYRPGRSRCFIISDPKKREIFAAEFRDRIVHHLYYNMVHTMFERTFIYDSYSCIKGRGTHFGIKRLEHHIRSASQNYTIPCYVLKLDIKGYFMHIDRRRLLDIVLSEIKRLSSRTCNEGKISMRWSDIADIDFIEYLTCVLVLNNPLLGCHRCGSKSDWYNLPKDKSLFFSSTGCGLPIGNLTSQLFSNIYLNRLDQYIKRTLGIRHYGRYVDDFFLVSENREGLLYVLPLIRRFLSVELGLTLHEGKIILCDVRQGIAFLGAFLKPWRRYLDSNSVRRMSMKIKTISPETLSAYQLQCKLNSFIGVLSHTRSYTLLKKMMLERDDFWMAGDFVRYKLDWRFRT